MVANQDAFLSRIEIPSTNSFVAGPESYPCVETCDQGAHWTSA